MKEQKMDPADTSQDEIRLAEAKEMEAKMTNLQRVDIPYGYVMTTDPDKWKGIAEGSTVFIYTDYLLG